jgi:DNA-directed RNA polymerase specialized sigma24 family protein
MYREVTADTDWAEVATFARQVASQYVSREAAEDISQEVCVCLLRFDPPSKDRPLVQAMARKLAVSHLRSDQRRLAREREWAWAGIADPPQPEATRDNSFDSPDLSRRQRLLAGMLVEGFTVREISVRSGRPRSSVQGEIEELRRRLSRTVARGAAAARG